MSQTLKIYACSFTWTISNLALCPLKPGRKLCSPPFTTECLGNTKWRLVFYPKGKNNFEYMSLFLQRASDGTEMKEVVVNFKLTIKSLDTPFSFMKISRNICFSENEVMGYSEFARWDSTNVVDRIMPFGTFMIRCEVSPSDRISNDFRWNQRMDSKILSQDFTRLYESGKHHDIVLFTGHTEFYVHKAVLASRSLKFMRDLPLQDCSGTCTRMDMSAVPVPILKTLLYFIYSGKLDIPMSAIPQGLRDAAVQYEVSDLVRRIHSFPKAFHARTVLEFEHKYVMWRVKVLNSFDSDFLRFCREEKCDIVHCDKLIISCQIVHDTERGNGKYVSMSFRLTGIESETPISMLCTVHFLDKATPFQSTTELHAGYHVFEGEAEWHQAFSIDGVHLEVGSSLQLGFEIDLCDGTNSNFLHEEDVTSPDVCPIGMDDFRNLSRDFQKLQSWNIFTDFLIVCGGQTFHAHKAVVSARSPVFEKMLEHDMVEKRNGFVVVNDMRPTVMRVMLSYMYSGLLGDLTHDDVCDLYEAADKYAVFILKERCFSILREKLNAQNVERVLDLAELHSDKRLECIVKKYIRSNSIETDPFPIPETTALTPLNFSLQSTMDWTDRKQTA